MTGIKNADQFLVECTINIFCDLLIAAMVSYEVTYGITFFSTEHIYIFKIKNRHNTYLCSIFFARFPHNMLMHFFYHFQSTVHFLTYNFR
jgi:hypothetical protein